MSKNDITGDKLITDVSTDAFRGGWDAIWGKPEQYACKFCGAPSLYAPEDQSPPPDYCHASDHGFID